MKKNRDDAPRAGCYGRAAAYADNIVSRISRLLILPTLVLASALTNRR